MSDTQPIPTEVPESLRSDPPTHATTAPHQTALAAEAGGPPPNDGDCEVAQRYHVRRFHKRGGMGRVFVAAAKDTGHEVALKDIQPDRYSSAAAELFEFEAAVTASLEHPGVTPVYGRGRGADGRPFYVMRFVDGQTFTEAIRAFHDTFPADKPKASLTAEQVLTLRQLLNRFLAVCQTVAFAHSKGVIHRDLKPGNILLGPFGETVVIDWGLAKQSRNSDRGMRIENEEKETSDIRDPSSDIRDGEGFDPWEVSKRVKGRGSGTPGYWAPEQAAGRLAMHDERTDVYALGAVLYHVLTGASPHPTGKIPAKVPNPKGEAGWVDDELNLIVRTAMSRRRRDRYQSATELSTAVERWLADQPIAAQRATVATLRQKLAQRPDDMAWAELLARQAVNLGLVLVGMGRYEDALDTFAEAVELFDLLHRRNRDRRFQAEVANCHMAASQALARLGRGPEAGDRRTRALNIYRGLFREFPNSVPDISSTFPALPEMMHHPRSDDSLPSLSATSFEIPALSAPKPRGDGEYDIGDEPIPGYRLVARLGRGPFGPVWKAIDPSGKRVAVKVIDLTAGAVAEKGLRAYKLIKNLDHPHLVPMYTARVRDDTGRTMGFEGTEPAKPRELVIVLGLAERTLADLLAAANPFGVAAAKRVGLPIRDLIGYMEGAAKGIDYLNAETHDLGDDDGPVVHCDIKPATLFVAAGEVRVGEFDVAVLAARDGRRTQVGGTMAYNPPELIAHRPCPGTDQYSLAVTYFELRTGRYPFPDGVTPLELMTMHAEGRLDFAHPAVSDAERVVLQRATAVAPTDRFPTCGQFIRAVKRAAFGGAGRSSGA